MKPELKAKELLWKYADGIAENSVSSIGRDVAAKACAIIAADEMIEECRDYCETYHQPDRMTYWQQVKQAIEKM